MMVLSFTGDEHEHALCGIESKVIFLDPIVSGIDVPLQYSEVFSAVNPSACHPGLAWRLDSPALQTLGAIRAGDELRSRN